MTTLVSNLIFYVKTLSRLLYRSVSSVKFYEEIYTSYRGYGIKYIFILSIISSLLCNIVFLSFTNDVQDYFAKDIVSANTKVIDNVLQQLPDFNYNGREISLEDEDVIYIYEGSNKLAAIDFAGKLAYKDRVQVPILLLRDQININIGDGSDKLQNKLPIKYSQIFGSEPEVLTHETIKSRFSLLLRGAPKVLIYLIFPIMAVIIFINTLIEKSLMIIFIFLISMLAAKLGKNKGNLKDIIRVVLFSSGIYTMLVPLASITFIEFQYLLGLAQSWMNILMILGILKSQGRLPPWMDMIKRRW